MAFYTLTQEQREIVTKIVEHRLLDAGVELVVDAVDLQRNINHLASTVIWSLRDQGSYLTEHEFDSVINALDALVADAKELANNLREKRETLGETHAQ